MAPHAAVPTKPISGLHALKLVALAFLTDNNMTSVASDHSLTATLLSLVHMHPATPPPLHNEAETDNTNDWKEHCGAGVLALEDCAANKAKKQQFVNQTRQEQRRLKLQEPQWEYDGFLLELMTVFPAFGTPHQLLSNLHSYSY